jgi:hypothetical protein
VSTQATQLQYSASDGVNIPHSGPLDVRNVLVVTEDGVDGVLVAAIVNTTSEPQTLNIEYGEGSDKTSEKIRVPANGVVSLGTDETDALPLEGIDSAPGTNLPMFFQSGDSEGVLYAVPVLDGSLDYYGDLLP